MRARTSGQISIALRQSRSTAPAGSFMGGFRTPAPYCSSFLRRRRPEPFTMNPSPKRAYVIQGGREAGGFLTELLHQTDKAAATRAQPPDVAPAPVPRPPSPAAPRRAFPTASSYPEPAARQSQDAAASSPSPCKNSPGRQYPDNSLPSAPWPGSPRALAAPWKYVTRPRFT
jgi:hypothetical protein